MTNYQFIDLQDGNMAIGLALQDNYTLLLEVRNYHTHQIDKVLTGSITSISDGMLYTTLGPFSVHLRHTDITWQNMEVVDDEWDKEQLLELFPESAPYWFLMKTKNGQYCVGSHCGPCNPIPFFYLEDPNDLSEFIHYINIQHEKE